MKKLTIGILREHGACNDARDWFVRNFPRGTNCTKIDVQKFEDGVGRDSYTNVSWMEYWACDHLLNYLGRALYYIKRNKGYARAEAFAYAWRHQP
jgi:hypothetical protein